MIKHLIVAATLSILGFSATSTYAETETETENVFQLGKMAKGAPHELQHWGKMVGQWSTTEESLKADGSGWQPSNSADWDFFWAFDGWGIQDNYTSPPSSQPLDDESTRQRGINLRIYNPKEKKWVLTWLTTQSAKPMNISATSTDNEIVMLRDDKDANGNFNRITFFDIADDSFEWKMELSSDQVTWREVYRIHGKKK